MYMLLYFGRFDISTKCQSLDFLYFLITYEVCKRRKYCYSTIFLSCSKRSSREGTVMTNHESVTFIRLQVTKISLFFVRLSIILHRRERERNFFYFSTRAFNSYKLIYYGECLYIAHALRVKVANFDINYRRIGTLRKKMVRLTK